ncbi:NADH-quinone oxidoreductase subunit L [Roseococcus sp. SDR]|uniref:NADH-quinone oxidoreductase subunit L n=1 Tax=Roseococcus sp. SDR TaxID=2835532 RepID=UPI001BCDCAFD|nr:NADH-quinone oxidoreductase subunit L [Roseococcus sp. SDR]MBS7792594.1 NADH-quinone oxidoreductase subunit L [Roseococcus sp. SDR]MBV1847908.1 NADH-quinone oxidoreductase subunit L [Roseococcus sp. SDR]
MPWIAALAPVLLILAAALPGDARRHVVLAAQGAFACALTVALALLFNGGASSFLVHLDAVSGVMFLLVAFIGLIVTLYSRRYLDGDPGQARFFRWLGFTLAAVLALTISGNLLFFAAAWVATSLCLHRLLVFYPERHGAQLAARKKFVASRLGDVALIAALLLILGRFGTLEFGEIFAATKALSGSDDPGIAIHLAAVLVAFAAVVKSAQFPLHGWLPEVMETPTPVSALLHAGIINAGGFLVVRMADLVALSAQALDLLLVAGAATAIFGAAVMLTQTSVKVALAWSTVAQMGFMILQCGLGAFAAAMLHIVAHAMYKAHAFLSAGSVIAERKPGTQPPLPLRMLIPALAASVLLVLVVGVIFGMPFFEKPGVAVLGATLMMGLTPMLAGALMARDEARFVAIRVGGFALAVCVAYFALQAGAEWILAAALPEQTVPRGPFALFWAALTVLAFATLLVLNVLRRRGQPGPGLQAFYVHLFNGFYVNAWCNRLVAKHWPLKQGGV